MQGCNPIQSAVNHYPRLTKGVAVVIGLVALGAIACGAAHLITQKTPFKFYNQNWAIGSIAAGSAITLLALITLCHHRKEEDPPPYSPPRERKGSLRQYASISTVPDEEPPPQVVPNPGHLIKRFGHTVQLPSALSPSDELDGMPDNSFYIKAGHTYICAQIYIDGEKTLFFQKFHSLEDPMSLLQGKLENPQHFCELLFPALHKKRKLGPENYMMVRYCNMEILIPKKHTTDWENGYLSVQATLLINGAKRENLFTPAGNSPDYDLRREVELITYYCDYKRGIIASKEVSYELITNEWNEVTGEKPLKVGQYRRVENRYSFCHQLKNDRGYLHTGTLEFESAKLAPEAFRERIMIELMTLIQEGKILGKRATPHSPSRRKTNVGAK